MQCTCCHKEASKLNSFVFGNEKFVLCELCASFAWSGFKAAINISNQVYVIDRARELEAKQRIRTKEIQAARQNQTAFQVPKE